MAFVPQWKRFETRVASLIHGRRFWANSGEKVDCEGPVFVAQCKLVRQLSLESLTSLAITAHEQGRARGKAGLVAVKQSGRGGNIRRPILFVIHEDDWRRLHGIADAGEEGRDSCGGARGAGAADAAAEREDAQPPVGDGEDGAVRT